MGKKRKFSEVSGSSSSSNSPKVVKYEDLPGDQIFSCKLSDDFTALSQYDNLIDFIGCWGCKDGFLFEGIRSLNCVEGYPLIQVELVCGEKSAKFLISRATLYILAFFCTCNEWRVFQDIEMKIEGEGFHQMDRRASYTSEAWSKLGPKEMMYGLGLIQSEDEEVASEGCEIFMVHFSEACRLNLVKLEIERCLMPTISTSWHPLAEGEVVRLFGSSEAAEDILNTLKPIMVDLNCSVPAPPQVKTFIKQYKALCKCWCVFALSRKTLFPLNMTVANQCGIISKASLRYSLSVLCNINLYKVLDEWRKKFNRHQCPEQFKKDDFEFMVSEIKKLLQPRKAEDKEQ